MRRDPADETPKITVAIPTLNGSRLLARLLPRLKDQTLLPEQLLVIDSSSEDDTVEVAEREGAEVHVIARSDFSHGGTRNMAVELAKGTLIVFLSHDVFPVDGSFLENLTAPIRSGQASASYARQRGGAHAKPTERFLREYNYPQKSHIRSAEDIEKMGLHAYFFSNAASAYDIASFESVGGFPTNTILGEDLIVCARLLKAGHRVAYAADAVAEHTHNYTLRQQFRRYFDTGAAHLDAKKELEVAATTSKGREFAIEQIRWMWAHHHRIWIPYGAAESATKLAGYSLGRRHRIIPLSIKRRLSMHRYHW